MSSSSAGLWIRGRRNAAAEVLRGDKVSPPHGPACSDSWKHRSAQDLEAGGQKVIPKGVVGLFTF